MSWILVWLSFTSGACSILAIVWNIRSIANPPVLNWRIFAAIAWLSLLGAIYVAATLA